ncbi:MAG: methyltransferase domain-containing protein [Burkholderiales bacterium]
MNPCRFCAAPLTHVFCDLGLTPLANEYPIALGAAAAQTFYPLSAHVCSECWLVQVAQYETPENLFSRYAYFSSYSASWLEHAKRYAYAMKNRLHLGQDNLVIEIASNDGYLLRYFLEQDIPVLGVEPALNAAAAAQALGIRTVTRFLDTALAESLVEQGTQADLLVANNVLAHVPDLNDFVRALAMLLKPEGVLTLEFPHLLKMIQGNQFDTLYHEHFSYFSLATAQKVLEKHGLALFDVEELSTHGGSLRLYAQTSRGRHATTQHIERVIGEERAAGLGQLPVYQAFQMRADETRDALLTFLIQARREGKTVAGYGAAAKGNTFLNYCGVRGSLIGYVVDASPHKQGRLLPGTHVPIHPVERLAQTRPDYILILAWNLKDEIMEQMRAVRDWGAKFVVAVPRLEVLA